MTTKGSINGARKVFTPQVGSTDWGALVNRFLRSMSDMTITKLSILPMIPHGTYLGGYSLDTAIAAENVQNEEQYDILSTKTNSINSGYRRLPVLGGANDSFFVPTPIASSPMGTQNVRTTEALKNKVVSNNDLNTINNLFGLFEFGNASKNVSYNVFNMARTQIILFNPQYKLLDFERGYLPAYEVCDINSTSSNQNPLKLYPAGHNNSVNIGSTRQLSTDSLLLEQVAPASLFCIQYYWSMTSSSSVSENSGIPYSNPSNDSEDLLHINPGTAHALFIEFGAASEDRYTNDHDGDQ